MGNTSARGRRHRGSRPGMLPVVVMLIAFALASCSSGGTATPSAPSGALTWSTRTLQPGATSTVTSRSSGAAGTASSTAGKPATPTAATPTAATPTAATPTGGTRPTTASRSTASRSTAVAGGATALTPSGGVATGGGATSLASGPLMIGTGAALLALAALVLLGSALRRDPYGRRS